jgi:hypothetical protein
MLKKILIALAVIIIGLLIVIATRPSDFSYTRSAVIPAAPEAIFPHINDMHKWQEWSPWAKVDPNCKITYDGPTSGTGAKFSWVGNNEVGEGSMTIAESKPSEFVRFKLDFIKPFEGKCDTLFTLKPEGAGTQVTWTMSGKNGFMGKAIGLVMDCDKMCGDQFSKGLENLKGIVTAAPSKS